MLVIGARGTFFARSLDIEMKLNQEIFQIAARHKGASICEMLTNCVIFNDGTHSAFAAREEKDERTIVLRDGEKMIFGKNRDKGLILENGSLKVVKIGENGITQDDILTHHTDTEDYAVHSMLINMKYPDYPVALGVIRDVKDSTYDEAVSAQVAEVKEKSPIRCMDDLLNSGSTWTVE